MKFKEIDYLNYNNIPNLKMNRILIANEETEVCNALSVAVRQWAQGEQRNVKIIEFENGEKAINYAKKTHKEPLFLGIIALKMTNIDGIKSAQIINDIYPKIPIIITASYNENNEILIKQADNFANHNCHIGFMVHTNSCTLLKIALESEIKKLFILNNKPKQEKSGIFRTLSELLKL